MTRVPVHGAIEQAFRVAASVRRARAFHPRGRTYAATVESGSAVGPDVRALVRLSRAAGLPDSVPDPSGIAVRLVDVGGPGRHQDLLLTSVWAALPVLRHLPRPTRRPAAVVHSSVLPLTVGGALQVVTGRVRTPGRVGAGLRALHDAVSAGGVRVTIAAVPLGPGAERPLLELLLGPEVPPAEGEALRFHPANAGAGLHAVGLLAVRDAAYVGSSRGRARRERR